MATHFQQYFVHCSYFWQLSPSLFQGCSSTAFHRRRLSPPRPSARARPLEAGPSGCHLPAYLQRDHVDHLHIWDAEGGGKPGAARVLRLPGLGHRAASDTAPVYFPSIPLGCHTRRDMEDELQGASRIKRLHVIVFCPYLVSPFQVWLFFAHY